MKKAAWVAGLVLLQGIALITWRVVESRRERVAGALVFERLDARPAPDLVLQRVDGTRFRLSDRKGRPVLLHFWASWCPPCKTELPGLLALGGEEVEVIAVTLDRDDAEVRRFFEGEPPAAVVQTDPDVARTLYSLGELPDTWLLDAGGTLRARFAGARDWRSAEAKATLSLALQGR